MAANSSRKLFVSRLRWTDCSETLRKYFSKFGRVNYAIVIFDRETGWSKNYGFVAMGSEESVRHVLDHNPHILQGNQQIEVALHATDNFERTRKQETRAPPLEESSLF